MESHLGSMMDLIWVFLMYPLVVTMVENLWDNCLNNNLDNMMELCWVHLMALLMELLSGQK